MVDRLSLSLSGYTPAIAKHLVSGFTFGFSIHHKGQRVSSHSQNLMCTLHNPDMVDLKIEKEHSSAAGTGCFLSKTGIKNSFRIIPVHPLDFNLLVMQ